MGEEMIDDNSSVLEKFSEICDEISTRESAYDSEVEESYTKLLNFLVLSNDNKSFLIGQLEKIVANFRNARKTGTAKLSIDAIAYVMHELRWPEILKIAISEQAEYFSQRREATLVRLIDSFNDDWSEAESYVRFCSRSVGSPSRRN